MTATRRRAKRSIEPPAPPTTLAAALRVLETSEREKAELLIENGRLRGAVAEGQAREVATADVLRLIGEAGGDAQAALDAITERAARLCDAADATLFLLEGDSVLTAPQRTVAKFGDVPPTVGTVFPPLPLDQARLHHGCGALLERRTIHMLDLQSPDAEFPYAAGAAKRYGMHTYLVVPLLSGDRAIGIFQIRRREIKAFADQQIALVETFARQAAVAIEHARLFGELQERLEEQTATSEVLASISHAPTNLQSVLDTITDSALRLCSGIGAALAYGPLEEFHHISITGAGAAHMPIRARIEDRGAFPIVYATGEVFHSADLREDERVGQFRARAAESGMAAGLIAPLIAAGEVRGVLAVWRTEPRAFSERQIALIRSFADQAVIAIENARLFSELNDANATLKQALEQQTATADVLREMGRSALDLPSLLDQLGAHVYRLTGAQHSQIWRFDGARLSIAAIHGATPAMRDYLHGKSYSLEELSRAMPGRAARERRIVQEDDVLATPAGTWVEGDEYFQRMASIRAAVAIPLLRGDTLAGVLTFWRDRPQPFGAAEVALAQTFADQAAIAIENARLFSEVKERLEEQTATAEVLRVISESPTALQTVLDTIADHAGRLCGTETALVSLAEGDVVRYVAGVTVTGARRTLEAPGPPMQLTRDEAPATRAIVDRGVVHLHDLAAVPVDDLRATSPRQVGVRSVLCVPLLHEERAVGTITLTRPVVLPFTERQIALVQTFADQAVIAIQNTRLFQELNDANRTLQEALEQQTATAEVLRVISGSPSDLPKVMDAIGEAARRLCRADTVRAGIGPSPDFRGVTARARLERRTVHVRDVLELADEYPDAMPAYRRVGARTIAAVPLLRNGEYLGAISASRKTVRPFTEREIALLETFADQAVIAVENTRLFTELRDRDERRRVELERASAIQQRLLPASVQGWPHMLEIACRFRPAVETSGDFYDVLPLAAPHPGDLPPLQIAVGDVAGKGMSAALVTALARSALRSTGAVPTDLATPANTLRLAGRRLHADVGGSHFVACALAVVEPPGTHHAGPRLRLANAAQVPVLLVRGGRAAELEPPGYRLPLGAQDVGDYKDVETDLVRGDVVVFSSDGLVEAPSLPNAVSPRHLPAPEHPGELFGFARLAASAAHWSTHTPTAESVAAGIWSDLTAWCGDHSPHDDVTLLVIRVPGAGTHEVRSVRR